MIKNVAIINIKASRAKKQIVDIKAKLESSTIGFDKIIILKDPKKLPVTVKKYAPKAELIVLAGGDGTIISGIQAALEVDYSNNFALLPVGTSNYLARNIHINMNVLDAIDDLANSGPRPIHLAKVNDSIFSLMATIGVATDVSKNINVPLKRRFGQFAYVIEAFKSIGNHENFHYKLHIDDHEEPIEGSSHQIIFNNADLNQQLKLLPESKIGDSSLSVIVFNSQNNIFKLLLSLVIYVLSFGQNMRWMTVYTIKKAQLTTIPKLDISVDGEVTEQTPATITTQKTPINILVPKKT